METVQLCGEEANSYQAAKRQSRPIGSAIANPYRALELMYKHLANDK